MVIRPDGPAIIGDGTYPWCDPSNRDFTASYEPDRYKLAGHFTRYKLLVGHPTILSVRRSSGIPERERQAGKVSLGPACSDRERRCGRGRKPKPVKRGLRWRQ